MIEQIRNGLETQSLNQAIIGMMAFKNYFDTFSSLGLITYSLGVEHASIEHP